MGLTDCLSGIRGSIQASWSASPFSTIFIARSNAYQVCVITNGHAANHLHITPFRNEDPNAFKKGA